VPLATRQLHAGCSHFFVSSCMRKPPLTQIDNVVFRLTEFERYGFPTDAIAKTCFKCSSHPTPSSASSKLNKFHGAQWLPIQCFQYCPWSPSTETVVWREVAGGAKPASRARKLRRSIILRPSGGHPPVDSLI
jgi:hypothetical protein